jgi:hypothetical protein
LLGELSFVPILNDLDTGIKKRPASINNCETAFLVKFGVKNRVEAG